MMRSIMTPLQQYDAVNRLHELAYKRGQTVGFIWGALCALAAAGLLASMGGR